MIQTSTGQMINDELLCNYLQRLVNRFFKILPMRENNDKTLTTYAKSLQVEMLGCKSFIVAFENNDAIISLLATLQFFADTPDAPVADVKREVFRAIDICKKLKLMFKEGVTGT